MTGEFKFDLVTKAAVGAFSVVAFGIWIAKNMSGITKQIGDAQADELIGLVTISATQELPKLWQAWQTPAEQPLL
jgi:hypothetical protein